VRHLRRRDQDRREEHERQSDEVGGRDHRGFLAHEQGDSVREAGEGHREERRRDEHDEPPRGAAVDAHAEREPEHKQQQRLDHGDDPGADDLREYDREPRRRRSEEAVDDVTVEVADRRHARPAPAEEGVHTDDPRRQERDVRRRAAAQRADAREELPVEQQPDERLDHHERDPDRLAHEVPELADDHPACLPEHLHQPAASSVAKSRPV
jgi:hypothetical protein